MNGVEVARRNMGAPQMFIYADQPAFNPASTHGDPEALVLGAASDFLVEVRYSAGVLGPDEFLQTSASAPAAVWRTYTVDLGDGDATERTALLDHINSNGQSGFMPVSQLLDESYSALGKTLTLDSFTVDFTRGGGLPG